MSSTPDSRPEAQTWIGAEDRRLAADLYKKLQTSGTIPCPWSMPKFIAACAHRSGRRITIHAQPQDFWMASEPGTCMTGLLLALPDQDLILYRKDAPARYQEHQIAHELAHLLFEHDGAGNISDRQISALFGDLFTDAAAVRNVLTHNRISLSNAQERQAEALADLLLSTDHRLNPRTEHARRLFGLR